MEELKAILHGIAALDAADLEDRQQIMERMPQDVSDSNYYSGLIVYPLLDKMREQQMNLLKINAYLKRMYEQGYYRLVHQYLVMCYVSVGFEQPPYFLHFTWNDTLLKTLLAEIMADFQEYIADMECIEDE